MRIMTKLMASAAVAALALTLAPAPARADVHTDASSCYYSDASVYNKYGQRAGWAETAWCLDLNTGYFETTTGSSHVKDLVNGDGVAARVWLWVTYQDNTTNKFVRAVDTTSTSGSTYWGYGQYIYYLSIYVCLGASEPGTTNAYCEELTPPAFWP